MLSESRRRRDPGCTTLPNPASLTQLATFNRLTRVAFALLLLVVLAGCGLGVPSASARPTPTHAIPTSNEIEAAVRFRATFGLRSDVAWIQAVHNDPAADTTFGVPLLPDEAARVRVAQDAANAATDIVAAYGLTVPEDWAGMYVDQTAGGTVVARFKANVNAHQAALGAMLPAGARVEVRAATWTDDELRSFISRVEEERDWYATIGTELVTVEMAVLDHVVHARFNGPDPAVAEAIEAHYGSPPWLRAVWNGPGEWAGPIGELEIYTTDAQGLPVPDVDIEVDAENPYEVDVSGGVGWMTDSQGYLLRDNMPAVDYRVKAFRWIGAERVPVAEAAVSVPANDRIQLRLVVE